MKSLVFLGVHDKLHCSLDPESRIADCLPSLQQTTLIVRGTECGVKLAERIMTLNQLQALDMSFLPGTELEVNLRVSRTSPVERLVLVGSLCQPNLKVKLLIDKTDIGYRCQHIEVQSSVFHPIVPILDADFPPL